MQKRTKIFFSFFIVIVLLVIFDYASYKVAIWKFRQDFDSQEERTNYIFPPYWQNKFRMHDDTTMYSFERHGKDKLFRLPFGEEYKKPSIWIFGCSFVFGASNINGPHPNEEIFGYQLSQKTQRPVYTRGLPSWGVQHMYYQLEKGDIFNNLPAPEYVVYVFISDHARRMQKLVYDFWSDGAYLRYEKKNGKMVQIKPICEPLWKLNAVKSWLGFLEYNIRLSEERHDKNFDLFKDYLISSKEILQQHYPSAKFIILKYNGNDGFDRWFIETERWKEIEDLGFTVVEADKETGINLKDKEFVDEDGYHPNAKAWRKISDMLSKKYIK